MTVLKGMTWSHPRGYDPMISTAAAWKEKTGVEICWDKRSLQDFESYPVEDLARNYDLIIMDHPHVGQITAENCLLPLDGDDHAADLEDLESNSVGRSFASYQWQGHQWALPVDAATQVQAFRPDLIAGPAHTWRQVMEEARQSRVILPLRPPHSLMCFFTLAANLGTPCNTEPGDELIEPSCGARVLKMLGDLSAMLDAADFERDPIAASEAMSEISNSRAIMPLAYGYANYATDGFREKRLAFADIPAAGDNGPSGSALGGTGISVSAFSKHPEQAVDYAFWVAGADIQKTLFSASGGQPGHLGAWKDPTVNAPTNGFYRNTLATLETAWVRPRFDGYMDFQQSASDLLTQRLRHGCDLEKTVSEINVFFAEASRRA